MKRYDGDDSKRDSHENIEHLTRVFNKRNEIIKKLKWNKITCSDNGEMRSINAIHREVSRIVYNKVLKEIINKK